MKDDIISKLKKILTRIYTPEEIALKLEQIDEINTLKKQMNAVILGHNYMTPDVFYGVSDITGDSLELARRAATVDADIIIFNGVHFMAETAKILNPDKLVLIADRNAGCSLADSITADDVQTLRAQYPHTPVVTYINCSAEVKAVTDICCTSGNALKVVESLPDERIIFLPDKFLADNIQQYTTKTLIGWDQGKCMVHELYSARDIEMARRQFEEIIVIAHPECSLEVTNSSDFVGSTSQMQKAIADNPQKNIMLITECSMGANLQEIFPTRNFVSTCHTCPHMKKITLEKILHTMKTQSPAVEVAPEIITDARRAVERMIAIN